MENKNNHHDQYTHHGRYSCVTLLRNPLFHLFIITVIGLLVYANTLHVPLQFDDNMYITSENLKINPADILDSASIIRGSTLPDTFKAGMLTRRFSLLTFMLNYKIHGLSVTGFHIVNIFIHLVTALLVYALTVRLWHTPFIDSCYKQTEESREKRSRWTAFLCGALFVAHPVNTQAVTYIVQRFTSLATLLYLLALLAYLSSALQGRRLNAAILYGVALIAAVLSMYTKEISFTLPAVMILCDRLLLKRHLRQTFLAIAPFLLTMAIIPWNLFQAKLFIGSSVGGMSGSMSALAGGNALSRHDYFLTQLRVIVTYIRLMLFPVNQNLDYDYPIYASLFVLPVVISLFLLLAIASFGFFLLRTSATSSEPRCGLYRLMAFGIFWFFITLSVESSFQPIENVIYEHRLYLPFFGFVLAFVCAVSVVWDRVHMKFSASTKYIPILASLLIAVFAIAAHARNAVWKNQITLWEDVVQKSPANMRARTNLGAAYLDESRLDESLKQNEIITREGSGLSLATRTAHFNIGVIFELKGRQAEALQHYRTALFIDRMYTPAYIKIAEIYKRQGQLLQAAESYRSIINLKRGNFEVHYNLSIIYIRLHDYDKALSECLEALKFERNSVPLYNNLGVCYSSLGQYYKALESYQKALSLDPANISAQTNMQTISAKLRSAP